MYVPVRARLGLYALKTSLYVPGPACIYRLEPQFGPVRPGNLTVRTWALLNVPVRSRLGSQKT